MNLNVAGGDRGDAATAAQDAGLAPDENRVAAFQTKPSPVICIHQHVVAAGAVQRVTSVLDNAVELLAAPRREPQLTIVCRRINFNNGESGASVGSREFRQDSPAGAPRLAKAFASPLRMV